MRTADDAVRRFDAVVIASHAPQALAMLADADALEREVLGAFRTTANSAVLHTDVRLLPRRALGAGVLELPHRRRRRGAVGRPTVTYYLNKLQALDEPEHYCVTLNRDDAIAPERVHPPLRLRPPALHFDVAGGAGAPAALDGRRRTFFCGAYHGFGFHEDGLASGLRAAAALGAPGEVRALRGHAAARAHAPRPQRLPLPGVLLRPRPGRAARARPAPGPVRLQPGQRPDASATATTWATRDRPVKDNVIAFLAERGIDLAGGRVVLLTNLRLLGHVFNPVSYFYCYGADGELAAIVAEVGNTFGERHPYLLTADNQVRDGRPARLRAP